MRCFWESATGFDIIDPRKKCCDCVYKTDFPAVHACMWWWWLIAQFAVWKRSFLVSIQTCLELSQGMCVWLCSDIKSKKKKMVRRLVSRLLLVSLVEILPMVRNPSFQSNCLLFGTEKQQVGWQFREYSQPWKAESGVPPHPHARQGFSVIQAVQELAL